MASIAIVKSHDGPLDLKRPIAGQLQVISLSAFGGEAIGDSSNVTSDDGATSLFLNLQQFTRHVYAPLVRAAMQQAGIRHSQVFIYL